MELTRRDAVAALLAGGAAWVGTVQLSEGPDGSSPGSPTELTNEQVRTLTAVADVVYPTEVTATGEFVERYVAGVPGERQSNVARATAALDEYARRTQGERFAALSASTRDSVLRSMGVDRTGSAPDGTVPERVRYYVVNQLLYGLYTAPKGASLVGIDNPVGYSGGYESYQQSPSGASRSARRTRDVTGATDE